MSTPFKCENCGSTSYEQFSQTQVRCMNCKSISEFDTGYKTIRQFEMEDDSEILDTPKKPVFISASLAKRFINNVIDMIFIMSVYSFFGSLDELMNAIMYKTPNSHALSIFSAIFVIYYIVFEFLLNKTIGKFITRTRIISNDGSKPSLLQCIGRTFSRFLPFENISFIILGIFKFNSREKPFPEYLFSVLTHSIFWHDMLPNTLVAED
ncbi:MAG: RDD family protein [Chitinophagales bacterium]